MENLAIFNTAKAIYKTANRLACYRKYAKEVSDRRAARGQDVHEFGLWKYWHRNIWEVPNNTTGKEGQRFTDYVAQIGDFLGEAHSLLSYGRNRMCTGYYADVHQCDEIKFGVCRLRSPRGAFYVPVTWLTDSDGCTHWLADAVRVPKGAEQADHESAIDEAARAADSIAEREAEESREESAKEAEESREESAKEAAEQDISDAAETIHAVNVSALALIREIKAAAKKFTPAICSALRCQLTAMLAERRAAFETIAERRADYWSAVKY